MFIPDQTLSALLFGLLLGMQHALEPDHVVAVSTIVGQSKGLRASSLLGTLWGLGHTATLLLVALVILIFKLTISDSFAMFFEMLVGIMLVALGLDLIRKVLRGEIHSHVHHHEDGTEHVHLHSHQSRPDHGHRHRSLLVGMLHGLAGSGALILLMLTTVDSLALGVGFILAFGAGLTLGMALMSLLMALPLQMSQPFLWLNRGLRLAAGLASIVIGAMLVYEIAVVEQLLI